MFLLKLRPFAQSFFDMQAPRQPHMFLPFSLLILMRCRFFRVFLYHCRFLVLCGEYVVRFFLPDGVSLPCDHGPDFLTSSAYYVESNVSTKPFDNVPPTARMLKRLRCVQTFSSNTDDYIYCISSVEV